VRRNAAAIAWAAAAFIVILELLLAMRAQLLFGDFRAFYCAGSALLHGGDPYAGAPLYACEAAPMPFGLYHAAPSIAVPAPFPGYVLAFFAIFGALPYLAASVLWLVILLGTTAASCIALARIMGQPIAAAISVVIVALAVVVLPYGELTSIEFCALLWLALALRAQRWVPATVAGAFAMILPHVGLPSMLGIFVWQSRMRLPIVVLAVILGALDIVAGGPHTALRYVTSVLPAHTLSEIGGVTQYGLTWVLHGAGAGDALAVRAGEASYVAMLIVGVIVAGALARRSRDIAYAVLVPPAFAVFGGSFMHYTEIIAALGAAAMLAVRATQRARVFFACALILLALPWLSIMGQPLLAFLFAIATAAIISLVCRMESRTALRFALGAVILAAAIEVMANRFGPALPHGNASAAFNPALAQASWAQFVSASRSSTGIVWWIAKAPTWIGLALLTIGCAYAVAKEDFVSPVAVEQAPVVS
jgi:hypothetical protein